MDLNKEKQELLNRIKGDPFVHKSIDFALNDSHEIPWDDESIVENVHDAIGVMIDLNDAVILSELRLFYSSEIGLLTKTIFRIKNLFSVNKKAA